MANDHKDLDQQIAAKKNEWTQARTAELEGRGSAEATRRLATELKALEARKNQPGRMEQSSDRETEHVQQRNRMVRKLRMNRSR